MMALCEKVIGSGAGGVAKFGASRLSLTTNLVARRDIPKLQAIISIACRTHRFF